MFTRDDIPKIATSLALVAIASLAGPVAAGSVALSEVVKQLQRRYTANGPARELRQLRERVTDAITTWAEAEKLTQDVELGMTLAAETIWKYGADTEKIAKLHFDADATTKFVLDTAKDKDTSWGKEDQYAIADRCVLVTYRILVEQLEKDDPVLMATFRALQEELSVVAARGRRQNARTRDGLAELADALVAVGTLAEVMSYLQARIADWDVSVWHPDRQQASALERRLRVRTSGQTSTTSGQELSPEDALGNQRMLVVLGGPGSGKSWLARRYARQSAQKALAGLVDGAGLDVVQIPVLTTWDRWTKTTTGTTSESLVASSFASGLGHRDPGEGGTAGRLQRTFLDPKTRVLCVVDSLDEAADHVRQTARLYELLGLPARWQVIVTSRQSAWDATYLGDLNSPGAGRVVEVSDLTDSDVEDFIRDWFADLADPARGQALITAIRGRPDLARVAVVPLMLTFYCLLAETSNVAAEPLPARRRELYRRLVRRLFVAAWTASPPGPNALASREECETLLADWAFSAVRDRVTVAGLGQWGDTFTQPPGQVQEADLQAMNHVAPKVTVDGEGNITRRFVHRTFLEHFVAEHIATLDTDSATDQLLPHLWFDPDWQVTAPAAIVAHNQRHPGALLQEILNRAGQPPTDPARQVAADQLVPLLLAIAEESTPKEWTNEHQRRINECRSNNAARHCERIARSAHWTHSNPQALANILTALPTAGWRANELVAALAPLAPTKTERDQARATVLDALPRADRRSVRDRVAALLALDPTDNEKAQALTAVLAALAGAKPGLAERLVGPLLRLAPTTTEPDRVRGAVLAALPGADPNHVGFLVAALLQLSTTKTERDEALTAVLAALEETEPSVGHELVAALPGLGVDEADSDRVRVACLAALPKAGPWVAPELVATLLQLSTTKTERDQARTAVLAALPGADPSNFGALVAALLGLEPTDDDRAKARATVLTALENGWPLYVDVMVAALLELEPTTTERDRVRGAVLAALRGTEEPLHVGGMVAALLRLDPTDDDRAQVRTAIVVALHAADEPWVARTLTADLLRLAAIDPTKTEAARAEAREAILAALPGARRRDVGNLMTALLGLDPTKTERDQARTTVLAALEDPKKWVSSELVAVLSGLVAINPSEDALATARTVVLDALQDALRGVHQDSAMSHVCDLVPALRSVSSVESWLAWLTDTP